MERSEAATTQAGARAMTRAELVGRVLDKANDCLIVVSWNGARGTLDSLAVGMCGVEPDRYFGEQLETMVRCAHYAGNGGGKTGNAVTDKAGAVDAVDGVDAVDERPIGEAADIRAAIGKGNAAQMQLFDHGRDFVEPGTMEVSESRVEDATGNGTGLTGLTGLTAEKKATGLGPVIDRMAAVWGRSYSGAMILSRADRMRLIQVLKQLGEEELVARWERYVGTEDPWPGYTGRPVAMFLKPAHLARFAGKQAPSGDEPRMDTNVYEEHPGVERVDLGALGPETERVGYRLWKFAKDQLIGKIDRTSYEMWIAKLEYVSRVNDVLTLAAPTEFEADWARRQYGQKLVDAIDRQTGRENQLRVVVGKGKDEG